MPKIITREHIELIRSRNKIKWNVSDVKRLNSSKRYEYFCRCKCGKTKWISWAKLQKGESTACNSCAKISREFFARRNHPVKEAWYQIKKKSKKCGIKNGFVDFRHFMIWSSTRWVKGCSLYRKDIRGDFSPSNCEWRDKRIFFSGSFMSAEQFGDKVGKTGALIRYWIKKGKSPVEIYRMFDKKCS